MDWNNLVQKLVSAVLWTAAFGTAFGLVHRRMPSTARWMPFLMAALVSLGGYRKLQARLTPAAARIESYSGYDVPFAYARELLSPNRAGNAVLRFMGARTNLPHSAPVEPATFDLVPRVAPHARRPHIFLITVDSLRQDYLSAYNPAVRFTPALEAFARESTVFEQAFTHYGGTGLSQPSIWAGGMLIHKQYVTPFAPMNLLEKLVRGEGYRLHVSRDEILTTILGPRRPGERDLDEGKMSMNFDLCGTLEELGGLAVSEGSAGPVFAYTQPQNLHISVIQREGAQPVLPGDYSGFHAPYASRVRRLDGCFGRFISRLKQTGLYDSSIIVFTADHGDSLGEEGRWGHAYTLFPEIVRIPLLVHVPPEWLEGFEAVRRMPVFSTGITPALYRLLGYENLAEIPMGGRSLYVRSPAEAAAQARPWYLLASSYAPVYGVLSENGRRMYVADAVNFRDYWYDLSKPQAVALPLSEQVREVQQSRIREGIEEIDRLFRYGATR